jgi:hypothetical protein
MEGGGEKRGCVCLVLGEHEGRRAGVLASTLEEKRAGVGWGGAFSPKTYPCPLIHFPAGKSSHSFRNASDGCA